MSNGRVSIVFSTYNSSEYIERCLESCLNQDYGDLFIIIADDGSTDDTIKKIEEKCGTCDNFRLIPLPHGERGIARSTAIAEAKKLKSDYIYIIDSDMVLKDNLISECIDFLGENKTVGALVIPEIAFSDYNNFYSKVKVFERNVINDAGEDIGSNSVEAARFWKMEAYDASGGINVHQISFEETQPTIRYIENGGIIKRAIFTGVYHDEKEVTLKNIVKKKRYYFSVMNTTIETEQGGAKKAFSRWFFFRPVLYRKENLKKYVKHPVLTLGMIYMYLVLTLVGIEEILKAKIRGKK
ncbi:glycosyltransferase family 2 protein [Clostridium cellulovorans]|uniref:Glycosyl transferase family 2 n=1 Tax=Clostridium cellulovorans (strain ATCC 35296 / DSM 3052 / OCM 3 / 743B) TaxID=573061 RepID=D9STB3_CLOC7|nr:glycosyltransferase family 2 protein [Clostridium cellulovorans]ADL50729.1 glycosyl transferase family 2 [Clostridium cellulovorans 743B]